MQRFNALPLALMTTQLFTGSMAFAEDEAPSAPATVAAPITQTITQPVIPAAPSAPVATPAPVVEKKIEVRDVSPSKQWISDRVETPVRSCPGDRCKIVKVVRPGNEITVTGYTNDGWAFITVGETKGFILKRYLQDSAASSQQCTDAAAHKPSLDSTQLQQGVKAEVETLRKRTETAETETGALRKENYELKQELDYIKGLSNQTLMVNEENRRLKTEAEMLRQRNEILEQEARDGEGRDQRAWVIVGAGIIIVGWILGRFARMPRRKGWNQI